MLECNMHALQRLSASMYAFTTWHTVQVLGADTSAISTLRCLKLYLERLGSDFQSAAELHRVAGQNTTTLFLLRSAFLLLNHKQLKHYCMTDAWLYWLDRPRLHWPHSDIAQARHNSSCCLSIVVVLHFRMLCVECEQCLKPHLYTACNRCPTTP